MEFVWGRYSALFYTGAGAVLFIGFGILFGSLWFFLAVGFLFLFIIGITDYAQKNTRFALKELLEAAGLSHLNELNRRHIVRRLSASQIKLADQIYPKVENGALLRGKLSRMLV